ncbi:hypothetical protein [Oscillatoria sp. FACHB-1406]|uniref:hypothetical protein n=1 Tax=Oscillatoria sp. FACHB-1406 TaxID=2692846 RepID=UPI00168646E1|nr:hypothetical protein [Oscillatoria sp. FACHB-1406]MBD2578734.1 hypothetical protein [Oscillatoria sp. FACHB-1406]
MKYPVSYIRIDREKISPQQIIFHGIEFRLDRDLLERIQVARSQGKILKFSSEMLTDLRHYALFSDAIAFSTFYQDGESEERVVRSHISFDGAIACQICNDYLQDERLILSLTATHHWLIQQILRGLHLETKRRVEWLAWVLAAVIVGAIALWQWSRFPIGDPVTWVVAFGTIWLLHFPIALLLGKSRAILRRWFWYHLLFGRFSRNDRQRHRALSAIETLRATQR